MSGAGVLDQLIALDLRDLKREVDALNEIKQWALASLGLDYATGDRVEIITDKPSTTGGGWSCYAEALAAGQTGIAGSISFNTYAQRWDVLVGMDRCWSTHTRGWRPEEVYRIWCGPAAEVPEGFEVSQYYPAAGKIKWFGMPVSWVKRAAS